VLHDRRMKDRRWRDVGILDIEVYFPHTFVSQEDLGASSFLSFSLLLPSN